MHDNCQLNGDSIDQNLNRTEDKEKSIDIHILHLDPKEVDTANGIYTSK